MASLVRRVLALARRRRPRGRRRRRAVRGDDAEPAARARHRRRQRPAGLHARPRGRVRRRRRARPRARHLRQVARRRARERRAHVARYRPLVEAAAEAADIEPDTLEAHRPARERRARRRGRRPAARGRGRAHADPRRDGAQPAGDDRSTRRARGGSGARCGAPQRTGDARAGRSACASAAARVDERFDPPKALAATARYLVIAREELGRDDLAVVSYHMGIGNLQNALRDYGEDDISYARLYFDSTPLRHAKAYRRLAALGDDSATYLWRVAAAREIMRLYRSDPAQLDRISRAAEREELRRGGAAPAGRDGALRDARRPARGLRRRPDRARCRAPSCSSAGLRSTAGWASWPAAWSARARRYRGLREPALALLAYVGAGVKSISGDEPLVVTSTVRDERYQRALLRRNREATPNYSLHTTGWAFDILRTLRARARRRSRSSSCSSACSRTTSSPGCASRPRST